MLGDYIYCFGVKVGVLLKAITIVFLWFFINLVGFILNVINIITCSNERCHFITLLSFCDFFMACCEDSGDEWADENWFYLKDEES